MHIPSAWAKASADVTSPDGSAHAVSAWGWGEDEWTARKAAAGRLQRVLDRIRCGEPFPARYSYGSRPLREEILERFTGGAQAQPVAVLTRNSYGAQVLNASRLLFLDVDLQPPTIMQRLRRLFGGPSTEESTLARLRQALHAHAQATFRIYRTASGFRVLAIDREFDPAASDVRQLMQATDTDPAYARLCLAQRSFRARLTPKPWRCQLPLPPGRHPRSDSALQRSFASWLREYENVSAAYASCRYLETVGSGRPRGDAVQLLALHDRITRCDQSLPLA